MVKNKLIIIICYIQSITNHLFSFYFFKKADMGWTKRSSGNGYNSQSDHSNAIGLYGRKIIDSCTYCKVCNICEQARVKNITPKKHYCAKNWEGTSQSMESSAILEICKEAPSKGYHVGVIISDDDTTIRAHLKHKKAHHKMDKGKLPVSNYVLAHASSVCYLKKLLKKD